MKVSRHTQLAQLTIPRALKIQLGVAGSVELTGATVLVLLPGSDIGLRLFAMLIGAIGLHSLVSLQQAPYSMRSALLFRIMAAVGICLAAGIDLALNWPAVPDPLTTGVSAAAAISIPLWSYWLARVERLPQ